jgi:hypothetical protein
VVAYVTANCGAMFLVVDSNKKAEVIAENAAIF